MSYCQRHSPSPGHYRQQSGLGVSGGGGEPKRINHPKIEQSTPTQFQRIQLSGNPQSSGRQVHPVGAQLSNSFTSPFVIPQQLNEHQLYSGFSPVRSSRFDNQLNPTQYYSQSQQQQQPLNSKGSPGPYFQQYVSTDGIPVRPKEIDQDKLRHEIEAREHELKLLSQMDYLIGLIRTLDDEMKNSQLDPNRIEELEKLKESYASLHEDLQKASVNPNEVEQKHLLEQAESIRNSTKEQPFQEQPVVGNGANDQQLTDSVDLNNEKPQPMRYTESILKSNAPNEPSIIQLQNNHEGIDQTKPPIQEEEVEEQQQLASQQMNQSKEGVLLDELKLKEEEIKNLQIELREEIRQRELSAASFRPTETPVSELAQKNTLLRGEVDSLYITNEHLKKKIAQLEQDLAYIQQERDLSTKQVLGLLSSKDDIINRLEKQIKDDKKPEITESQVYKMKEDFYMREQESRQREAQLAVAIERNDNIIRTLQASLKEVSLEKELIIAQSDATFLAQQTEIAQKDDFIANLSSQIKEGGVHDQSEQVLKEQLLYDLQKAEAELGVRTRERDDILEYTKNLKATIVQKEAVIDSQSASLVQVAKITDVLDAQQENIKRLENEVYAQKQVLDLRDGQIARLEDEADQLKGEVKRLQDELREQPKISQEDLDKIKGLEGEVQKKDEMIGQLNGTVEKLQEEVIQAGEILANLERELKDSKEQEEQLMEQLEQKDRKIKEQKEKFKDAIEDEKIKAEFAKEMQTQLAVTNAKNEEALAELEEEIEQMNDDNFKLKEEVEQLQKELDDEKAHSEDKLASLQHDNNRLADHIKQLEEQLAEQQESAAQAKEEQKLKENLAEQNRQAEEELAFVNGEVALLKQRIIEDEIRKEEVGVENQELRQRLQEKDQLFEDARKLQEDAMQQIAMLQALVEDKQTELNAAVAEKDAVKAEYEEITATLVEMENTVVAMQGQFMLSKQAQEKLSEETKELQEQLNNKVTEEQIQQSIQELKNELNISDRNAPLYESHRSHSQKSLQASLRANNSEQQPSELLDEVTQLRQSQNEGKAVNGEAVPEEQNEEEIDDCANCNLCLLEEMTRQNELLKQQLLFKEKELIELRTLIPNSIPAQSYFNLSLHRSPIAGGQGQIYVEANDSISQNRPNTSFFESPIKNQKQGNNNQPFSVSNSFASPLVLNQQQFRGSLSGAKIPQQPPNAGSAQQDIPQFSNYSVLQNEIDHLQKIFESKCKEVDSWKKTYNQLKNN